MQMETAEETTEVDKASERLLFTEECQLITYMSVVKGKLEVSRFVASQCFVFFNVIIAYKGTKVQRNLIET